MKTLAQQASQTSLLKKQPFVFHPHSAAGWHHTALSTTPVR
jgi:hypothetical protein